MMITQTFKVPSCFLATVLSILTSYSCCAYAKAQPQVVLDRMIAVVNQNIITETELSQRLSLVKSIQTPHQRLLSRQNPGRFRNQVLQKLIQESLVKELAKKSQVQVASKEVDHAILEIAQQNRLSVSQFKQQLINSGVHYPQYRYLLKQQILLNKLQAQSGVKVSVSDQEIRVFKRDYFKQQGVKEIKYHLWDFVVPVDATASPQAIAKARAKAESIAKRIQQGVDIAQLSRQAKQKYPNWPGGDLGWQTLPELPKIFAKQVAHMSVRAVSPPLKAPNGFHIIQLIGKDTKNASITDLEARHLLYQKAYLKAQQQWLKALRDNAYVKVYL